jgi:hypothetical protein
MARMGQLSGKLGEQQVIDLLEQVTIHRWIIQLNFIFCNIKKINEKIVCDMLY